MKILLRSMLKRHSVSIAMMFGAIVSIAVAGFASFADECERIPEGILRLHILAESNSQQDQAFKLEVRDYVLDYFADEFADADSMESARERAIELLPQINAELQEFASSSQSSQINAEVTQMYFTTRVYENLTLPAGEYNALRITIGEGEGDNWWCVMFPPLCVPAVSEDETVDVITSPKESNKERNNPPKVKFALYEFLSKRFR